MNALKILVPLIALVQMTSAGAETVNAKSKPLEGRLTYELKLNNTYKYDVFCQEISFKVLNRGEFGDAYGSYFKKLENVYLTAGQEKVFVAGLIEDGIDDENMRVQNVYVDYEICEKAIFKNYCQHAEHTESEDIILQHIFKQSRADYCDEVKVAKIKKLEIENLSLTTIKPAEFLPNLRKLEATGNEITSLQPLMFSERLTHLDVSNNPVESIEPLKNARELKYVNISNSDVTSIEVVKELLSLKTIEMESTKVSKLKTLLQSKSLRCANFNYNRVSDYSENSEELDRLYKRCF